MFNSGTKVSSSLFVVFMRQLLGCGLGIALVVLGPTFLELAFPALVEAVAPAVAPAVAIASPTGGSASGPRAAGRRAALGTSGTKARAKVLFKEGIAKFDEGYYQQALALFVRALKIYPSPKIHTRIALCYKWLGNNLKALEHYERYLKSVPTRPVKARDRVLYRKVHAEVRNLRMLLAQLRVDISGPHGAEVMLNGKVLGTAPFSRTVRVAPGRINITAIAKGYHAFKRDISIARTQFRSIQITMIRIRVKTKVVVRSGTPVWKRWWFWTAIGVVVAGTTGMVVGFTTQPNERQLKGIPVVHDALNVRW